MIIKRCIKKGLLKAYQIFYGVKDRVVFISFDGRSYSDNPKAISESLHTIAPDIEIVWALKRGKEQQMPQYAKVITPENYRRYLKTIVTSKCVVTNFAFPVIPKSRKQLFIQTWHGDKAFKKIQYDNPFVEKNFFRAESVEGFCDICVAGSDYGERKFRSAFKYKGEILKVGTPRNDRLVFPNQEEIISFKKKLGINDNTHILMYAPTIRKKELDSMEVREIDFERTLDILEKRDGCEWKCFLRAHPGTHKLTGVEYSERIVDVSDYEEMSDLLLITDFLISDYSSCAGDYALLGRKIVLFQADIEDYLRNERSFYYDIKQSPYYVAESQEELEMIINTHSDEEFKQNCLDVLKFYGDCESGHAAEEVANRIIDWINS